MIRRGAASRVVTRAAAVALAALSVAPPAAWACPVCVGDGFPRRVALAYLGITGVLSALPVLLAGLVLWLGRRSAPSAEPSPPGSGVDREDA